MKTTGIIAEYNPLHNGHLYQMQQARRLSGSDYVIVVMSPDFVQRGEPALLDKWVRARMALEAGADLVLEMPVRYATGSAEHFAEGGVSVLDCLGVVDSLSFGCETGHTGFLMEYARFLSQKETEEYRILLQKKLRKGISYAEARTLAWLELRNKCNNPTEEDFISEKISDLLRSPNNILAVEYMKAVLKRGNRMKLFPVLRVGAQYHDLNIYHDCHTSDIPESTERKDTSGYNPTECETSSKLNYASASGIRNALSKGIDVSDQMPPSAFRLLSEEMASGRYLTSSDLDLPLRLKLYEARSSLTDYVDVNEDLANRINHLLPQYTGFDQFTALLKTKQVAHTRVRRALLHILLEIRNTDASNPSFARVLGFRKRALPLLSEIKEHSSIPMVTKLPPEDHTLSDKASERQTQQDQMRDSLREDLRATELWELLVSQKTGAPVRNERQRRIVIV